MHRDLGTLNAPVLLFGGPYSNAQATEALFHSASALGIPSHRMICTGDVVAYCGAPRRTMDLIRDAGITVVAGNCEKQLGQGAADCGCGFDTGTTCDLLSRDWYTYAQAQMRDADRAWMRTCPDIVSFHHQGFRYAVIHGGMTDIARFIWSVSPEAVFEEEWQLIEDRIGAVQGVIAGHCGIPFERHTSRGRWINAGVIGMPPHDGSAQTRFAVLAEGTASFRKLSYDVTGAQADMALAGLAEDYRQSLRSGYWPSEDILPDVLRDASLASG